MNARQRELKSKYLSEQRSSLTDPIIMKVREGAVH